MENILLLPTPRTIYTSKPIWHGVDDIAKVMYWPSSTQSDVTIPGESYTNFGPFGVLVAIGFAMIYGLLYKSYLQDLAKIVF